MEPRHDIAVYRPQADAVCSTADSPQYVLISPRNVDYSPKALVLVSLSSNFTSNSSKSNIARERVRKNLPADLNVPGEGLAASRGWCPKVAEGSLGVLAMLIIYLQIHVSSSNRRSCVRIVLEVNTNGFRFDNNFKSMLAAHRTHGGCRIQNYSWPQYLTVSHTQLHT